MEWITQYLNQTSKISSLLDKEIILKLIRILLKTREEGGRLFLLGSGGGAGHASHATCDFRKICGFEAYCPTDNISELTARINDEGWESALASYLQGSRLSHRDCIFIFSVGGGSPENNISTNLVRAIQLAKEKGARVVGIVGRDEGYTAKVADACIVVPTVEKLRVTAHTEGFQAILWHLIISHPLLQQNMTKWESTTL